MSRDERDRIRAEYADLFGITSLVLAQKSRKSAAWMAEACEEERESRDRCLEIRES